MNMNFKSWLIGTTMLVMTTTGAFAEVVFNRGNSADPESLDPHKTSTVYEAHILRDLFLGLTTDDAKAEVIPGAAESWTISPDGKVYTFKLRAGATGPMVHLSRQMISSFRGNASLIRQLPLNMPICWLRW